MSGKGSSPRPFSVTQEEYANRWDAIFGRDVKEENKEALEPQNENKEGKESKELLDR